MQIGKYQIVQKIGEGSMGKVFLVTETGQSNYFALKMLLADRSYETRYHRFMREIRSMTMLSHPHIVEVYDSGTIEDVPYFVMEYVDGESLAELLIRKRKNDIDLLQAITFIDQIAAALDYLHDKDIIHRDLKPSNIMLTSDNMIKLTDFGLVKFVGMEESMMTETGTIIGTVKYMSPEQALGKHVDSRSDIYSLGVIFFLLATGSLPFTEEDPISLLWKIIRMDPAPPIQINDSVPLEISQIIQRMMAKNPDDRFPTAKAVINELLKSDIHATQETVVRSTVEVPQVEIMEGGPVVDGESIHYCFEPQYIERANDLEDLQDYYYTCHHISAFVTVHGPDGIGKTRFVREFANQMIRKNIDVVFGRYLGECQVSYPLVSDLMRNLRSLIGSRYGDSLAIDIPDWLIYHRISEAAFFRDTYSSYLKPADFKGTAYEWEAKRRKFNYWQSIFQILRSFVSHKPLILVLEDMHFNSCEEWELLRFLMLSMREVGLEDGEHPRLFIIATIQKEAFLDASDSQKFLSRFSDEEILKTFELQPFSLENTTDFICSVLGVHRVDQCFVKRLHSMTDGNPFFIEELVRYLVRQKQLCRSGEDLVLAPAAANKGSENNPWEDMAIPNSLYDIVADHLKTMQKEHLWYLKIAAVAGYQFDFDVVQNISGQENEELYDGFQNLIRDRLLVDDPFQETVYHFRQPLVQQVLYASLDVEERRDLHQKIADYLQEEYSGGTKITPDSVAYHYECSESAYQASYYWGLAAVAEYHLTASLSAEKMMENALFSFHKYYQSGHYQENLSDLLRFKSRLLLKSGYGCLLNGNLLKAARDFDDLAEIAKTINDPIVGAQASNRLAEIHLYLNDLDRAEEYLTRAAECLDKEQNQFDLKKNREIMAKAAFMQKKHKEAIDSFNQVLQIQLYLPPNPVSYAHDLCNLAHVYADSHDWEQARKYYYKACRLLEKEKKNDYSYEPIRRLNWVQHRMGVSRELSGSETDLINMGWQTGNLLDVLLTCQLSWYPFSDEGAFASAETRQELIRKLAWILDDSDLLLS